MIYPYLLPESDGLPTCPSGLWATEKLDYLRRYIDVFETSMRWANGLSAMMLTCKRGRAKLRYARQGKFALVLARFLLSPQNTRSLVTTLAISSLRIRLHFCRGRQIRGP